MDEMSSTMINTRTCRLLPSVFIEDHWLNGRVLDDHFGGVEHRLGTSKVYLSVE